MRQPHDEYGRFAPSSRYSPTLTLAFRCGHPRSADNSVLARKASSSPYAGRPYRECRTCRSERSRQKTQLLQTKARAYDRIIDIGLWWSDVKTALMTPDALPPPPIADPNPFVEEVA